MNVIVQLGIELNYFKATVQHFSHYTMKTTEIFKYKTSALTLFKELFKPTHFCYFDPCVLIYSLSFMFLRFMLNPADFRELETEFFTSLKKGIIIISVSIKNINMW